GHSVPNAGVLISTECDNPPAIRTKLSGRGACVAPVRGDDPSAVRTELRFPDKTRMFQRPSKRSSGPHVPDTGGRIFRRGYDTLSIGTEPGGKDFVFVTHSFG